MQSGSTEAQQRQDMDFYFSCLVLAIAAPLAQSTFVLRPVSSINIPFTYSYDDAGALRGSFGIDRASVEQSAYDAETGLVYVAGKIMNNFFAYTTFSFAKLTL